MDVANIWNYKECACVAYLIQASLNCVKQRGEKVKAVPSNTYVSYQRRDMFCCKIVTQSGNCKAVLLEVR